MSRFLAGLFLCLTRLHAADTYDVCVYGGNASGVMAACAAAKEGAQVIVVEPSRWLGGMTGGGLMHIDWGREEAVSGSTRPILKQDFNDAQYRKVFAEMLKSAGVTVLFEHRVSAALKVDGLIRYVDLDFAPFDEYGCPPEKPTKAMARVIKAKVFIDCSYEGDLMARAGIAYAYGREAKSTYDESLAGAQPPMTVYVIDPYVKAGAPQSGLLPGLQATPVAPVGEADKLRLQGREPTDRAAAALRSEAVRTLSPGFPAGRGHPFRTRDARQGRRLGGERRTRLFRRGRQPRARVVRAHELRT
jgi:hypothetical protein